MSNISRSYLFWQVPESDDKYYYVRFDALLEEQHSSSAAVAQHTVVVDDRRSQPGYGLIDHVRPEPAQVSLDVLVSNTPTHPNASRIPEETGLIFTPRDFRTGNASTRQATFTFGDSGSISGQSRVNFSYHSFYTFDLAGTATDFNRAREAYRVLEEAKNSGTTMRLVSPTRTYHSMVITSISSTRDSQYNVSDPRKGEDMGSFLSTHAGGAIQMQIDLQEVRIGNVSEVEFTTPAEARGQKKKSKKQDTKKVDDAESDAVEKSPTVQKAAEKKKSLLAEGADAVGSLF